MGSEKVVSQFPEQRRNGGSKGVAKRERLGGVSEFTLTKTKRARVERGV